MVPGSTGARPHVPAETEKEGGSVAAARLIRVQEKEEEEEEEKEKEAEEEEDET